MQAAQTQVRALRARCAPRFLDRITFADRSRQVASDGSARSEVALAVRHLRQAVQVALRRGSSAKQQVVAPRPSSQGYFELEEGNSVVHDGKVARDHWKVRARSQSPHCRKAD